MQAERTARYPPRKAYARGATSSERHAWDLAYYDLEPELDAIPTLLRQNTSGQVSADAYDDSRHSRRSAATSLDLASETAALQRATGSEQFYRQLVRVWQRLQMLLSLVTLGLILWHLEYAAMLLINAR